MVTVYNPAHNDCSVTCSTHFWYLQLITLAYTMNCMLYIFVLNKHCFCSAKTVNKIFFGRYLLPWIFVSFIFRCLKYLYALKQISLLLLKPGSLFCKILNRILAIGFYIQNTRQLYVKLINLMFPVTRL